MSTPPNQSGKKNTDLPIEQQLDELLIQIDQAEPGAVDPEVLPGRYRIMAEAARAEEQTTPAQAPTEAADPPQPAEPEQATPEATPEQADMLSALNSALQGISGDPPADEPAEPKAESAEELSMEQKLQQEIASLMNSEPQVDSAPTASPAAPDTGEADNAPNTEDQIAMEIEGLLNADTDSTATDTQADQENAIDELDKMLASEIDADDELAGDFQTVEDVTAGIQVDESTTSSIDHAATARDVAAELDSQPEDLPAPPTQPTAIQEAEEDPLAVLAEIAETAEKNEIEHQRQVAVHKFDWQSWLADAKERLFSACFAINWPARRLSAEWRANLGYIALLNLFFGVGLWLVLILF